MVAWEAAVGDGWYDPDKTGRDMWPAVVDKEGTGYYPNDTVKDEHEEILHDGKEPDRILHNLPSSLREVGQALQIHIPAQEAQTKVKGLVGFCTVYSEVDQMEGRTDRVYIGG